MTAPSDGAGGGGVLAGGGSAQTPGAILLAGVAALRAGAGKLQLATVRSAAAALGVAVPESLVVALGETRAGEIAREAVGCLRWGRGMSGERGAHALMRVFVRRLGGEAMLVLDAAAVTALRDDDE